MNKYKHIIGTNRLLRLSVLTIFAITLCVGFGALFDHASMGAIGGLAAGVIAVPNGGRQVHYISGIQGVASGGVAQVNLPTNCRYHRLILNVTNNAAVATVDTVISSIKLIVNGIAIRDIAPLSIMRIVQANGYIPKKGELPIFFTENGPFPNMLEPSDQNSWDLVGQSTFVLQITLKAGLTNPTIAGVYEFDYKRNQLPNGSLFLQPIARHEYTFNLAGGRNILTAIPIDYPIRRLWFKSANAGEIEDLEIEQDGNKVFEASAAQMRQVYRQYGFKFETDDWDYRTFVPAASGATLIESATLEARLYFDAAFIADPDGRWWKALKIGQSLKVRLTATNAQALTIVAETLPGAFAS